MTLLEMKSALRVLQAEVTALRGRVGLLESRQIHPEAVKLVEPVVEKPVVEKNSGRKMCQHCGVKPNHFFHVKNCPKKKTNNGANEEANR